MLKDIYARYPLGLFPGLRASIVKNRQNPIPNLDGRRLKACLPLNRGCLVEMTPKLTANNTARARLKNIHRDGRLESTDKSSEKRRDWSHQIATKRDCPRSKSARPSMQKTGFAQAGVLDVER